MRRAANTFNLTLGDPRLAGGVSEPPHPIPARATLQRGRYVGVAFDPILPPPGSLSGEVER